jgi:hypothetical protein
MIGLRKTLALWATAGSLATMIGFACVATTSAAWGRARIVANPSSVMVNTNTTLRGTGFSAHTEVALEECGTTSWLAPRDPCNSDNGKTVETNGLGRFRTSFKVELCPEGEPGEFPTSRICYIGVPRFGIDTVALEPAAKLTVTYP